MRFEEHGLKLDTVRTPVTQMAFVALRQEDSEFKTSNTTLKKNKKKKKKHKNGLRKGNYLLFMYLVIYLGTE